MKFKTLGVLFMAVILAVVSGCWLFQGATGEEAATEKFKEWLVDEGVPEEPETPVAGLLLKEVEPGDVIGSLLPDGQDGIAAAVTRGGKGMKGSPTLTEKGRLFYLDEAPGAFYEHPGKIVVINSSGNPIFSADTEGWPTVNGEMPSPLMSSREKAYHDAIKWNPWGIMIPDGRIRWWELPHIFLRLRGAVVIDGLIDTENLHGEAHAIADEVYDSMVEMYGEDNVAHVESTVAVANPATRIHDAVDDLVTNEKLNRITLYLIGHGGNDYLKIGGYSYTVANLRTLIGDFPDVYFTVLMETCHAGSWRDNFDGTLDAYPQLDNLALFTMSTSSTKSAYPDWDSATTTGGSTIYDYNASDIYVEWTSDFLQMLDVWSAGSNYTTVQAYASSEGIESEWALFYYCFWKVKGSGSVPPAGGFTPGGSTNTLTERTGVAIQEPYVYAQWL